MMHAVKEAHDSEVSQLCCSAVSAVFDNTEKSPTGL